jgi:hypothetical protein
MDTWKWRDFKKVVNVVFSLDALEFVPPPSGKEHAYRTRSDRRSCLNAIAVAWQRELVKQNLPTSRFARKVGRNNSQSYSLGIRGTLMLFASAL